MTIIPAWKFLKETGICKTTGEAKNEIKQGAIKFNGRIVTENHFLGIENGVVSIVEINLNSEQEVQVSDTRDGDSSTSAD